MDWRLRTLQLAILLMTLALIVAPPLSQLRTETVKLETAERQRREHLSSLRAQLVADRISQTSYQLMVEEFASLTGLDHSRVESVDASIAVGRFVDEVQSRLRDGEGGASVSLDSISTGPSFDFKPFASREFRMHVRGTFFTLPGFMHLLTEVSREQKIAVSVGVLSLTATEETQRNGRLSIVVPVRAYVLAQ